MAGEAISAFAFVAADDSLTILNDGFVNRFQSFGFPALRYSSYEAPDYGLGGPAFTGHAPAPFVSALPSNSRLC